MINRFLDKKEPVDDREKKEGNEREQKAPTRDAKYLGTKPEWQDRVINKNHSLVKLKIFVPYSRHEHHEHPRGL